MIKPIVLFLKKHMSLAVMGLGAISIFIANIGLKQVLTVSDYYDYSIFVTALTLLTSFGALGIDQVLLRLSIIEKKRKIVFDKKIIAIAILNSIIMSIVGYLYLVYTINIDENGFIILVCCLSSIWAMLFYNLLRLTSYFLISQVIQNSWKIFFGVFSIVIFFNEFLYKFLYISLGVLMPLLLFGSLMFINKNIKIEYKKLNTNKEIVTFGFHFFLALLTLSFLSQGDRIIADRLFTESDFGDYFYLATLFLFPFSLFQSYIGFKELVYIKAGSMKIKAKLGKIFIGSLVFTLLLFFAIYGMSQYAIIDIDINKNLRLVIIFLIIGNIKMIYSLFSALIGVKATLEEIKRMNIIFIASTLIIFAIFLGSLTNIFNLLVLFCVFWLVRLIIWWYFAKKHFINET